MGRPVPILSYAERAVCSRYRYIELNPVRAGLVEHPADYRWSSYRVNGQGEKIELLHRIRCIGDSGGVVRCADTRIAMYFGMRLILT